MAVYRISGLRLAADLLLPELPRVRKGPAECRFHLLPPHRLAETPTTWLHRWRRQDGTTAILLGSWRAGYVLRFVGLADFLLARNGRTIRCRARPGLSQDAIRHLLLDQVMPMILAHRGRLTLHASAIKVGVGALAFAGKAGWGKSTLCAAFARMGSTPLADDCLVIGERRGRLVAVPGYPGLRLWPDAARALKNGRGRRRTGDSTGKRRHQVTPAQRLPESVALRAVYVLTAPGAARRTRIRRLGPHEIVGRLLAHTHRLDVSDRDRLVRELEALSRLARRVPVFELTCPRGLHRLAAVRAAVLRHAAAEA